VNVKELLKHKDLIVKRLKKVNGKLCEHERGNELGATFADDFGILIGELERLGQCSDCSFEVAGEVCCHPETSKELPVEKHCGFFHRKN